MPIRNEFPKDKFNIIGPEERQMKLKEAVSEWEKIRNEIIETIPSKEDGIDTARVEAFLRDLGIQPGDYLVITNDEVEKIAKIFEKHGDSIGVKFLRGGRYCGFYINTINLAFVNSTMYGEDPFESEGTLVHELIHESSKHRTCVIYDQNIEPSRAGFVLGPDLKTSKGDFIEEGFCEMLRAEYAKKFMPLKMKNSLETALTASGDRPKDKSFDLEEPVGYGNVRVPVKYSSPGAAPYDSFAGYGIELLCRKNPEIFRMMIEARGGVEGLRKVTAAIEALSPGLYPQLRKLSFNEEGFRRGLELIIDRLYGGEYPTEEVESAANST